MGPLGISNFNINGGYVFGDIPYPLLFNPIGNETPVYVSFAYNLLDFFEFSTDKYVELRYRHSFEGLILNKVPLFRKLKWRLVANANVLYGGLDESKINLTHPSSDTHEGSDRPFSTFGRVPYIELGYGIENIFKIGRIDAFHRITYLDREDVSKFGLKFSFQLIL